MALGEAIFENFVVVKNRPQSEVNLDLPRANFQDCCFELTVFADGSTDRFKNDQSSVIFFSNEFFASSEMVLQKYNGSWTDLITLSDNTYGSYFANGFKVNDNGEKLMGYRIDWKNVLSIHGEGTYRVKTNDILITGASFNRVSFEYCLMNYSHMVDKSVRIEWYSNGITGDTKDGRLDYSDLNWYNQIRLPDSFMFKESSEYEREFVRYQNGSQIWTGDTHKETYTMSLGRLPFDLHEYIKANILHADYLQVTTYDAFSPVKHIEKKLVNIGSYEPNYTHGSKLASASIELEPYIINDKHERC